MLRFKFNETKGVEALTFIASEWPGVTAFFASKVLFYAEKFHLNRYGRPIVADTFIAMPNGPVPSTLYDFIQGKLGQAGDPQAVADAIDVRAYPEFSAKRHPNLDALAPSDLDCLAEAIKFCRGKAFMVLSNLTHQEKAWREAPTNGAMDYEDMIDVDHPEREAVLEDAREFAAYGVL